MAFCLFPAASLHVVPRLPYVDFNASRLLEVALIASYMVCIIFFSTLRKAKLFENEIVVLVRVLSCLVLMSTALSPRIAVSVLDVLSFSLLLLTCLQLGADSMRFVDALKIFAIFNIVALGVYEFVFLVGYVTGVANGMSIHYKVLIHGVTNIRFFNQYQVWLMPILYWGFLHFCAHERRRLGCIIFGVAALSWTMLFFSSARGAILSLIVSLLFVALFMEKDLRRSWLAYVYSAVVGFALFLIFQYLIPALFFDDKPTQIVRFDDSGRLQLWGYAFDLWYAHPFLGVGPMNYASMASPTLNAHPHNLVLHALAEWGGFAAVIVTFFIVRYMRWSISNIRCLGCNGRLSMTETQAGAAIVMSSFGATIYSMLDGIYIMPLGQMTGVLVFSLIIKFAMSVVGTAAEEITGYKAAVFKTFIGILIIPWCFLVLYTFAHLPAPGEPAFEIGPRFWISGYLQL